MSLIKQWRDLAYLERTQDEYDAFWNDYLPKEQTVYEQLLATPSEPAEGLYKELADRFNMELLTFAGFLDGINTSLEKSLDLEALTEDSSITLNIDFEKLYYNMLDAQAEWLYTLPAWETILTPEKRKEIKKDYNKTRIVVKDKKIGRNDPCPCGSGRKYKQCCINK